jgi:hypothetical protein
VAGDEERIAEAVEAGRDDVAVPHDLVDEGPREVEKSLLLQLQDMPVAAKIKLALRGNREARMLLIRDTNKVIRRLVLRNPRIGEEELLMVANTRTADDELLRTIAENRDWTMNYQIRLALVLNPKTPLLYAMRFIGGLHDRDIRRLAKSKNVPVAVSAHAKRLVLRRPGG